MVPRSEWFWPKRKLNATALSRCLARDVDLVEPVGGLVPMLGDMAYQFLAASAAANRAGEQE
jgi:hypothetical protein